MIKKIILLGILCFLTASLFAGIKHPERRVLIVAIGDYPASTDGSFVFPDILVANDVPYLLASFKLVGFEDKNIKIMRDSEATKRGIVDAINTLIGISQPGDVVQLHFSSHGIQLKDDNGDEADGRDEAIVPYDYVKNDSSSYLRDDELMLLLNLLRKKVGVTGQIILSMDVSHSGPEASEIKEGANRKILTRGGFFEIDEIGEAAPLIICSACLDKELGYEVIGDNGESVGAWSYSFFHALKLKQYATFQELGDSIAAVMKGKALSQHPVIAGYVSEIPYTFKEDDRLVQSTKVQVSGDVFVLSIGISNYRGSFSFANCDDDAIAFSEMVRIQHQRYADSTSNIKVFELLNEQATHSNILQKLNQIISEATPDDYLFLNFAGFSWAIPDTNGKMESCFFPYGTVNLDNSKSKEFLDRNDKISLSQLRDLMEFIQAKNQLIITEAGPSSLFRLEFAKSMIEASPAISQLSKRNRVLIIPEEFGLDMFSCHGQVQGGPIGYFLKKAAETSSLFDLFSEDKGQRKTVQRAIERQEVLCESFSKPYMSFFYEKEFVEELQFFIGDYGSQQRGTEINVAKDTLKIEGLGKAYALVIGTGNYSKGAPDWRNLANPIEDANAIATQLKNNYGYEVTKLLDPSVDTLISALKRYSNILKEGDQFVLFIAGHGDYDPYFFDDGFLVLSNSLSRKADPNRRTYLPFSQLKSIIDNLPANQILLLIDVCFGGAFDEKISAGPSRSGNNQYEDVPINCIIREKLPLTTRIVITSGSLNTVPDGYMGKHSPFAARLISCFDTKGGDKGVLTSIQMFDFVQMLPSNPVRGELKGNDGGAEFFLIAKPTP